MSTEFEQALQRAIGERGPITDEMVAALSSPTRAEVKIFGDRLAAEQGERKRALFAVMVRQAQQHFHLDFSELFRGFLHDPDPVVRFHAIEGLWEDGRPDLVPSFVHLLTNDPDVQVRAASALSLGRFLFQIECAEIDARHAPNLVGALRDSLEKADEDIDVRRRALESLAYLNEEWVSQLIDRAYQSGDERMRESAILAMGRNADPMWAETVLAELYSDSLRIRYEATRASGELEIGPAVDRLIRLTEDRDAEIAEMAIWALGQIDGKKAREALEHWAASAEEAMKAAAEEALQEIEFASGPLDLFVYEPDEAVLRELDEDEDQGDDDYDDDAAWDDEVLDLN